AEFARTRRRGSGDAEDRFEVEIGYPLSQRHLRTITGHSLLLANAVQVVLEVEAAEEEGHHAAEGETDRLDGIEVLFELGSHGEAGDETHDEAAESDEAVPWVEHVIGPVGMHAGVKLHSGVSTHAGLQQKKSHGDPVVDV